MAISAQHLPSDYLPLRTPPKWSRSKIRKGGAKSRTRHRAAPSSIKSRNPLKTIKLRRSEAPPEKPKRLQGDRRSTRESIFGDNESETLACDIVSNLYMRPEFDKYTGSCVTDVAEILTEYVAPPADSVKSANARIRDCISETIRSRNVTPEWAHVIFGIFETPTPITRRSRKSIWGNRRIGDTAKIGVVLD